MSCKKCGHPQLVSFDAKSSDCNFVVYGDLEHEGYVPRGLNIGAGDYVRFKFCPNCGTMAGDFPVDAKKVLSPEEDEDD